MLGNKIMFTISEDQKMTNLSKYMEKNGEKDPSAIAFFASIDAIEKKSPEVAKSILQELDDQRSHLKLIASENYCSLEVQQAMGNLLTDKYSEGTIGKRFYAGCDNVDIIEKIAADTAKKIFGADHAYVQPHSGADANLVAFWAILTNRVQDKALQEMGGKSLDSLSKEEHEKIRIALLDQKMMGLSLGSGGHLTHGYRHNVSAKIMKSVSYDVDPKTHLIDYKALSDQVKKERPLLLIAGYSAYPRLIDFAIMRQIADSVNAVLMVDMAHFAGLVAGGAMSGNYDPVPFAHMVTSTTHKTLRGPRGGLILCKDEFKPQVDKGCPMVLGGPMPHVIAAKAIAFQEADSPEFSTYAHAIIDNAKILAEELQKQGVSVLTGGTDNHLVLFNVAESFSLTGRQAELALKQARLTVNRNSIPFDLNGAWYTSGIRMGTAAITTLGMGIEEMKQIARITYDLLKHTKADGSSKAKVIIDPKVLEKCQREVSDLLAKYPLYPRLVT